MKELAKIFKALGDENRLKIFIMISRRNICSKGISKHLNISESAVSQHIKVLKEADLIIGEKIGYHVVYNINKDLLLKVLSFINDMDYIELECNTLNCKATCKLNKNRCCEK